SDQVRVGDLLARRRELSVQLAPACVQHIDGDLAERGRRWHRQTVGHVLNQPSSRTGDRSQPLGNGDRGKGNGGCLGGLPFPFPLSRFPQHFFAARWDHWKLGALPVIEQLPPFVSGR